MLFLVIEIKIVFNKEIFGFEFYCGYDGIDRVVVCYNNYWKFWIVIEYFGDNIKFFFGFGFI